MSHEKEHISKGADGVSAPHKKKKSRCLAFAGALLVLFFLLWEIAADCGWIDPSFSASQQNYSQQPLK